MTPSWWSVLFIGPDADDEPTLWGQGDRDQPPAAILRRCEIPEAWREIVWNLFRDNL